MGSCLVGSWGKKTRVRPPRDIDLIFVLPVEIYHKYQGYIGNRQSALLQEVKGVLEGAYPSTSMSGDGQVVQVRFNSINVEVVPAFLLTNGQYWICDTHNGGKYKEIDPKAELERVDSVNNYSNKNLRPLVKMIKTWQSFCNVPIKSFWIEMVMCEYLMVNQWSRNSYFYYDWLVRDFFEYLVRRSKGVILVPGTLEAISLGDAWETKAMTALSRSIKACEHEYNDEFSSAGEEWQKIFGYLIPKQ